MALRGGRKLEKGLWLENRSKVMGWFPQFSSSIPTANSTEHY